MVCVVIVYNITITDMSSKDCMYRHELLKYQTLLFSTAVSALQNHSYNEFASFTKVQLK